MNIVILNGSPRVKGNTEILASAFKKGAEEAGHDVTLINLRGMNIKGCLGCQYCFAHAGACVQDDDMKGILEALDQTDMVVFASPIYWFDITAQLKTVIDRMYARGKIGFHFHKTALLLDSGTDHVYEAALAQYNMMTNYLKWENQGTILAPNMEEKGSMQKSPAMQEAYDLGLSLKD